jgi:hypothetical protein
MLAFMGIPLEVFITISAFHYLIQFLNHSRLVGKIPWAGKIFITPSDHRVHHGKNEPYLDKNFGGTFVIWDKIFRTFQPEIRELPVEYGIQDRVKSNSPLVINNRFISGYFFPVKEQKGNGWQYKVPVFYIVSGCLLLFGLLVCYLYSEQILSGTEKLMFFIIIFLGTVANGGLSDGKKWGILLWFLNGLLLGAVYLIAFRQTMLVQVIFMSLLMMHAVLVAVHASVVLKSIGKN